MKKIFKLFKPKKSEFVQELIKNFDQKLDLAKKSEEAHLKEKSKNFEIFKQLMNDAFYQEIDELMKYFDKKFNSISKADKCGFEVDTSSHKLKFYSNGYDNFPLVYQYYDEKKEIWIRETGNDSRRDKKFVIKDSREAEKYFLELMTKKMEYQIK